MKTRKQYITIIISLITAVACLASISAEAQEMTDIQITNQIENQFYNNTSLNGHLVDISTQEGIVTLSGKTNSLLARDRLVDISKSIKGVRGVINKITIKTPLIPNDELEARVQNALFSDPATESYGIKIDVYEEGAVQLTGNVDSWQEKQLAETVVKGVKGVTHVANDLAFTWEEDRPDSDIKADIERRLRADWRVDDGLIEVNVNDGKVTLDGMVGSAWEKSQAEVDAWVANVDKVDVSSLEVEPYEDDHKYIRDKYVAKSDIEIYNAIKDAFWYDTRIKEFNIDITVDSGYVTLTGEVSNLMAKKSAQLDASNIVGVKKVNNNIKVRPKDFIEDQEIVANIKEKIKKDPFINIYDIEVFVDNSKVVLDGLVASSFEKERAENLAAKTKGVVTVQNLIDSEGLYHHDLEVDALKSFNDNFTSVQSSYDMQDDETIQRKIETEIWWSPYVDKADVDIDVTNGVATLQGTVDSRKEKKYAAINALEGGAQRVDNQLIVSRE